MTFGVAVCVLALVWWQIDTRRKVREVSEEVSRLHKDFMAEVYMRYGESFNGEE